MPDVAKENFFLQLRNHLIFHMMDRTYILNYLYLSNINSLINPSTMKQVLNIIKTLSPNDYQKLSNINSDNKQLIEQHKSRIIQKLRHCQIINSSYCKNNPLNAILHYIYINIC